jgi:hypothetical protein
MKTSYYAMMKYHKIEHPVSIAGKCPPWYTDKEFKTLAPKFDWWKEWESKAKEVGKDNKENNDWYTKMYHETVLSNLSVKDTLIKLHNIVGCPLDEVTLLCYESPEKFCHRHLAASWIMEWYSNASLEDKAFCNNTLGFSGITEENF